MRLSRSFSRLSTLQRALCLSLLLHLSLLAIRFAAPQHVDRFLRGEPLPVILLNVRTNEAPEKAQAIAQSASAGGGSQDAGRASSPLPYAMLAEPGESLQERQQRIHAMQEQQAVLLAQLRQKVATLAPLHMMDSGEQTPQPDPAREASRQQLLKLLAEIEKRINEENARPKKRYISPATKEAVYAAYYDSLRRKIEEKGTAHFPEDRGRKLYGELVMILTINHDGQVLETEIVQGSGNAVLDRQAQAIARAAAPYGAFDAPLRAQSDQLAIVSRFTFTRDAAGGRQPALGISTVQ